MLLHTGRAGAAGVRVKIGSIVAVSAAVGCLLSASGALAVGDTSQMSCTEPPGTEESPGFRAYLPDCRAFELVTPPYQGGQPVLWNERKPPPVSADGQHLIGIDYAGFAGTENEEQYGLEYGAIYEFSRTSSGWITEALDPPASLAARRGFVGASADLSRSLWKLGVQSTEGEEVTLPGAYTFALREAVPGGQARFTDVGPTVPVSKNGLELGLQGSRELSFNGASRDLTHILARVSSNEGQLWPGDQTREGQPPRKLEEHEREVTEEHEGAGEARALDPSLYASLYEYVGTGSHEPALVGVRNAGPLEGGTHRNEGAELISECGTALGSAGTEAGNGSAYNAISTDGAIVYFTALHGTVLREQCSTPTVNELYARIEGSRTVAISEPAMTPQREEECSGACREDELEENGHKSPAHFEGASEDGSKVFFTTAQPLLNSDSDPSSDLYEAEVDGSGVRRLVQVSKGEGPTPGSGANVVAVARVSADGSHVYFVAKGVLTQRPNNAELNERAEEGAYNLYLYDTGTGRTSFIANLMTHAEVSEKGTKVEGEQKAKEKGFKETGKENKEFAKENKEKRTAIQEKQAECEALTTEEKETEAEECEEELKEAEAELKEAEAELKIQETTLEEREAALPEEVAEKVAAEGGERTGVTPHDTGRPFETTPDGLFLAFVNPRELTGSEDTSTVNQAFEYDAQTQTLVRISVGQCPPPAAACPAGERFNENGNTTNGEDAASMLYPRYSGNMLPTQPASDLSLSEDGRVVFRSHDALAPGAVEGRENVYQYSEGNVYLISPGDEAVPLHTEMPRLLGMSESGSDVFFFTTDPLVPQDTDTQAGWYDARAGGGFPAPATPAGCEGGACQGVLSATPLAPAAGSATQPAGENLPPSPASVLPAVGRVKVLGHSVHGTTITLKVAAPAKGSIVAYGAGLQKTTRRVSAVGTYILKVRLSARARASVKRLRRHKLRYKRKLTVRMRFVPTSGKASQTSVLAMVKA